MDEEDGSSNETQGISNIGEMMPRQQNQVAISPKRDIVKSTAIVKWSDTQFPVQFSQLSLNTNLNDAPDNWLCSDSHAEQQLRDLAWQRQHSDCSSFAMAHCYPDYAGEVDVVSEAENIKRLLKIPYDNSHASLIVHRVGRTLLLDNFDIQKQLLRQGSEDWTWLKEFFKNTVIQSEDEMKYVPRQVKSQALLQKRLMFSKFLYKSLVGHSGQEVEVSQMERHHSDSRSASPSPVVQHFVADRLPAIDHQVQFGEEGGFRRQMLWTFEHLRMLIGTDLPVFSVGDHPCVSLRLRESSQPINVVTGLDYWLDNLMCNVPEVAMCYHIDGLVQKYELIKTEDIPKMSTSGFDPHEVKDIATNILSFLRNSATKEGHTYWLYKCNRSDVVKLYDLTTLCDESMPQQGSNPFTIPVAMLLYRVGRKLHLAGRQPGQVPQIKVLLQNSLQLLDDKEHAEVCTSSYYLLSDLYIPDSCLRNVWVESPPQDPDQSSEEEEEEERAEFSVSVRDLMASPRGNLQEPRRVHLEGITGTPDERCKDGLQCLRKGLSCLEHDLQVRRAQRSSSSIVEDQQTCKASEAIPLRYEPLHSQTQHSQSRMLVQRTSVRKDMIGDTWHKLSKALLLRKASMANYILATEFLANKQPGTALKHVRYALHCFESMACLKPSKKEENHMLLMLILKTTSEVRHLLATSSNLEEQQRGYNVMSEEDTFILDSAQSVLSTPELSWVYQWTSSRSENLTLTLRCLDALREMARQQSQTSAIRDLMKDVTKKTGAIWNELGKVAMTQAENLVKTGAAFPDMESAWTLSMSRFEQGVQAFRKAKDRKNEVLMILNMTRLHRMAFYAYRNMENRDMDVFKQIRHHFEEACECYRNALQQVEHTQKQLRNNILWDLSSNYLNFGLYLQENPPPWMDKNKVLNDVGEMYRRAMKKCHKIEVEAEDPLWCACKDRLATIEFNLGEMYVQSYYLQSSVGRANKVFLQGDSSYKRAMELFQQVSLNHKAIQAQCKRIAFCFHHTRDKDVPEKHNNLLRLFLECHQPLQDIQSSKGAGSWMQIEGDTNHDPLKVLEYLLKPVLTACQQLLARATKDKNIKAQQQLKDMYRRGLELQNLLKDDGITPQLMLQKMAEFSSYLKEHFQDV